MRRARPGADLARRFCMRGSQRARRAPRALETVEKVLTESVWGIVLSRLMLYTRASFDA
jgi:hypothetical protein